MCTFLINNGDTAELNIKVFEVQYLFQNNTIVSTVMSDNTHTKRITLNSLHSTAGPVKIQVIGTPTV